MKFKTKKGRGFADENRIYDDKVVARKLNGYIVEHNDEEYFIQYEDIEVLSITEEEAKAEIRW